MSRDAEQAAIAALREATRTLSIGDRAVDGFAPNTDREPDLAGEVAVVLEAMVGLLRNTDLDAVPHSGTNHSLHAVVQHLNAGAELARRTAHTTHEPHPDHPESGRGLS